jgi:hypothetical protein
MALEHSIKRESVTHDGKAAVVADLTVYTDLLPRNLYVWVVSVLQHDGVTEKTITGALPLVSVPGTEKPEYVESTYGAATHMHIPLPIDSYYTVKSALLPNKALLSGPDVLGTLVADAASGIVERVTDVIPDGVGGYTYMFTTEGVGVETAVLEKYPTILYPILSIYELIRESERLNVSYVVAGTHLLCAQRIVSLQKNGCSNGGPERTMLRNLYFDALYQIFGAEQSFDAGYKSRVLLNLVEARALVEQIQTLIGK